MPSNTNWETLRTYLINNGYGYGGSGDDIAKSVASTYGWVVFSTPGTPGNDQASNNSSGLNILPFGFRQEYGNFANFMGYSALLWSSTSGDTFNGYFAFMQRDTDFFIAASGTPMSKNRGYSIRLVNNSTGLSHGQTSTMTDIDGNIYPTICIGTQEWMSKNLKVTHYSDNVVIPEVTDGTDWSLLTTGALCAMDNNWNNV